MANGHPSAPEGFFLVRGAIVRVKAGVHDPDFPDLDLGGWTARVLDVDEESEPVNCELAWTEETRRRIDPAWRERCESAGMDFDTIWLYETDLEPDSERTTLPRPELPADVRAKEERIRAALGVPIGADIPTVEPDTLDVYHSYLTARLVFPLNSLATDPDKDTGGEPVTLLGISTFSEDPRIGLVAKIRRADEPQQLDFVPLCGLTVKEPPEAFQLVEDYAFWFWSRHPIQTGTGPDVVSSLVGRGRTGMVGQTIRTGAAYGAAFGATTGALLATDDKARFGLWGGMAIGGLLLAMAGARFGQIFGAVNSMRFARAYGLLFGAIAGVLVGACLGVMLVGALGTISGAILGSIIGNLLAQKKWEPISHGAWMPLGACIGGLTLATVMDRTQAFTGALLGAGCGAAMVALALVLLLLTVGLASRNRS